MSIHAPDVRDHHDALDEMLPDLPLFEYGKVPGLKDSKGVANPGITPTRYALVSIERIPYDNNSAVRLSRRTLWRVSLRAVGQGNPQNCRSAMALLLALENERLTIDGLSSTPLALESAQDAQPDDGWYSALLRFTYAI